MSFIGWMIWFLTGVWFVIDCYQKRFRAKSDSYTPRMSAWVFIAERFFILLFFLIAPLPVYHIIWMLPLAKYAAEPLADRDVPVLSGLFLWTAYFIAIFVLAGTGRKHPHP